VRIERTKSGQWLVVGPHQRELTGEERVRRDALAKESKEREAQIRLAQGTNVEKAEAACQALATWLRTVAPLRPRLTARPPNRPSSSSAYARRRYDEERALYDLAVKSYQADLAEYRQRCKTDIIAPAVERLQGFLDQLKEFDGDPREMERLERAARRATAVEAAVYRRIALPRRTDSAFAGPGGDDLAAVLVPLVLPPETGAKP
jgi:hypothetical protein